MSSEKEVRDSEKFELIMLPVPELMRIAVSITAIEYDGFSSKRILFCISETSTNINPSPSRAK
jgi:hypothetical protein